MNDYDYRMRAAWTKAAPKVIIFASKVSPMSREFAVYIVCMDDFEWIDLQNNRNNCLNLLCACAPWGNNIVGLVHPPTLILSYAFYTFPIIIY